MLKSFFKSVDYYWFFVILTSILCFGFYLTNNSIGIDDEIMKISSSFQIILPDGRLGNIISAKLFGSLTYLPFWREFTAVLLYIIGISIHIDNFIKYTSDENNSVFDKKSAVIFACTAISFPFTAFHFIFCGIAFEIALNIVLTGICINLFFKYLLTNCKKYLIYIFMLLTIVFSYYEAGLLYFLIGILFIFIMNYIFKPGNSAKFGLVKIVPAILLCISAACINLCLVFILKCITGIFGNRLNEFFRYDITSLSNFIKSFIFSIKDFIQYFISSASGNFGSLMLLITYTVLFIILIYYTINRKDMRIIAAGLLMMIIPFSFVILMGGGRCIPYRVYLSSAFVIAGTLSMLQIIFKNNQTFIKILFVITAVIVFYQSQEMNLIFYTEHLKFNLDKELAYNIKHDIDKMNLSNKPMLFIGMANLAQTLKNYPGADELTLSIFNWDRYDTKLSELTVSRGYYFMRALGYNFEQYNIQDSGKSTEEFELMIKEAIKDMNNYPQENYIKDMDDFVLIKLGESKYE